jgi:cytidylate kinase
MKDRYLRYHGIVYPPADDIFDLVVDTTSISPEEVVEKIKVFLASKTRD